MGEEPPAAQVQEGAQLGSCQGCVCLLGKVSKLGEGTRQAAKRRVWGKHEEERRKAARRAYWSVVHRSERLTIPW